MNIVFVFIIFFILKYCKILRKQVEKYNSTSDIYVSFTTSPQRIKHIKHLLDTLSNQSIKPKNIILNLPHIFKRNNTKFDKLPEFISEYPLVIINRVEDLGPATKILGSLSIVKNPDDIIISVDDDIKYTENMIQSLYKKSNQYPDAVITGESFMRLNEDKVELLEGYSGVLYKRKFFDKFDIEKLKNYPKYCNLADDFVLSNYLLKNKIPIIIADKNNKTIKNAFLEYGNKDDALRNGAHGNSKGNLDNYKKCSNYLKDNNDLFITYYIKEMFDYFI